MFPRAVTRTPFTAADYAAAGRVLTQRGFYDSTALPGDDIWDFTCLRGRPGGLDAWIDPVAGTLCKSMVYGGVDAVVGTDTVGYDGHALTFTGGKPYVDFGLHQLAIGDVFMPWMAATSFQPGSNNRLVDFGAFQVIPVADANGRAANFEIFGPNLDAALPAQTVIDSLNSGSVAAGPMSYVFQPTATAGNYRIDIYVGKSLAISSAEVAFGAPALANLSIGAKNVNFTFNGRLMRLRRSNLVTAGMTAPKIIEREIGRWLPRLAAL